MRVVLWDTGRLGVSKDFAGGFGVGQYDGDGHLRSRVIRHFFRRDRRPVALTFAYLAAIFERVGHDVVYVEDQTDVDADLVVFSPSLITLAIERGVMAGLREKNPAMKILVVGAAASTIPEAFAGLGVTIVRGEAEQLLWNLDEVLQPSGGVVSVGLVDDLDALPLPDWSLFRPERFRIGFDFWRFPTALIQHSRGCSWKCDYCPYTVLDNTVRFRDPEAVADEMRYGMRRWGFRSFKFRDPLFGQNRPHVFQLAERIGRLPKKIQFSIETRIESAPWEVLKALREVGLTSITIGVETPASDTLGRHRRTSLSSDRQHEFVARCRSLGIRTVAGFLIGFPDDTEQSMRAVLSYAKSLNPTFANFNILTPYPGTKLFREHCGSSGEVRFEDFTVYKSVVPNRHLSALEIQTLHHKCFRQYYFRWEYLRDNAASLWPRLRQFGVGTRRPKRAHSPKGMLQRL